MTPTGLGGLCPRRIGFLFPHPCDRLTPIGCPHCQGGELDDPYRSRTDRDVYDDYDTYDDDASYLGASAGASMDFNEGDGENLVKLGDEFEDDLTES